LPDLAELRRLAEAATPGPWFCDGVSAEEGRGKYTAYEVTVPNSRGDHQSIVDTFNSGIAEIHEEEYDRWDEVGRRNAAFIAAANPAAILALIDRTEKAEAALASAVAGGTGGMCATNRAAWANIDHVDQSCRP
jgi:hypothetical protein